eukprot:Sspe_Gene.28105::Locus_12542_Transcript_1_1_Confidence_1.000_Length_1755::g.28105::m.28105
MPLPLHSSTVLTSLSVLLLLSWPLPKPTHSSPTRSGAVLHVPWRPRRLGTSRLQLVQHWPTAKPASRLRGQLWRTHTLWCVVPVETLQRPESGLVRAKSEEAAAGSIRVAASGSAAVETARYYDEECGLAAAKDREVHSRMVESGMRSASHVAVADLNRAESTHRAVSVARSVHEASPRRVRVAYVPDVCSPSSTIGYESPYDVKHRLLNASPSPRALPHSPRSYRM